MSKKIAIAYIPVLHKGYSDFLEDIKNKGVEDLYLIGDEILMSDDDLDYINRKDRLRALSASYIDTAIRFLVDLKVHELNSATIEDIKARDCEIITPKEDIGRVVVEKYFSDMTVSYSDIFLRWNKDNIGEEKAVEAVESVSLSDFQKNLFKDVLDEAANSTDWWRQVGAALVKNGKVLFVTHNEHMPEKESPNILGDTRALFKKGININYVTAAHAEVVAIAEAAKRGIATEGAELYVTDFPCPYCARLIAKSGIKKVYFIKGYAVLEGDTFLKEEGVKVVRVEI